MPKSFQCPGESQTISRAVHLGRLSRFFDACRDCEHRHDTGSLSARAVQQIEQTNERALAGGLFTAEGLEGIYLNQLDARATRAAAMALGVYLAGCNQDQEINDSPRVAIAGDGRSAAAELLAPASDGLRLFADAVLPRFRC